MDAVVVKESAIVLVQGEAIKFDTKEAGIFIADNNRFIIEAKMCYPGENTVMATPRAKAPTQVKAGEKIGMIVPLNILFPVSHFTPTSVPDITPPPIAVEQEIVETVTPSEEATPAPAVVEEEKVVKKDWRSLPRKKR